MRAARIHAFGEPLVLEDVPEPEAAPGETVVQLSHAGVNPLDIRVAAGGAGRMPLPFVPGCDGVGQTSQGPVVVYGKGIGVSRSGTYAGAVAVPDACVAPIPAGVEPADAAALGMAAVTAYGLVQGSAQVTSDDRVLVLGASGGVGLLTVQLARAAGGRVWAQTSSADDAGLLTDLGAEEVVVGGPSELRDARAWSPHLVIDPLGGPFTDAALRILASGGRIAVLGAAAGARGELDFGMLYRKAATLIGHATLRMGDAEVRTALEACLDALRTGAIRVHIDEVLPLDQVQLAHERLSGRQATGKLLLAVGG